MPLPQLSLLETRVLGVLVEKQRAVPDTYPLSLNALTAGCNQKNSRDPIMNVAEPEVQATIDALRHDSLVVESSGGRVMRYAHNLERVLGLPAPSVALLAVLMLRGPQTVGELRINCDRLHRFADISTVEAFLQELANRPAGALVAELARAAGARETRWMHLLSGPPADAPAAQRVERAESAQRAEGASSGPAADAEALAARLAEIESEMRELREAVAALRRTIERPS
jgi:uncharacterized protein YceH (UPF0502 family)